MKYNIGLDIRTDGVGWSVTDPDGRLLKHNGRHMFGSAVFEQAETSKDRRRHRSQRRQNEREKARINQLRELMEPDVIKADNAFFIRLDETSCDRADRSVKNLYGSLPEYLFEDNDERIINRENGQKSVQIYKIREALITYPEKKADIRYVYLAIAHIMKRRGYIQENENPDAVREEAVMSLEYFLSFLNAEYLYHISTEPEALRLFIEDIIKNENNTESIIRDKFKTSGKEESLLKSIRNLLSGGSEEITEILPARRRKGVISFAELQSNQVYDRLPEEAEEAVRHLQRVYECIYLLRRDLSPEWVSREMNERYARHKNDLRQLKAWFKKYKSKEEYERFFHTDTEAVNYNSYAGSHTGSTNQEDHWNHCTQEEFYSTLRKVIMASEGEGDEGRKDAKDILDKMYDEKTGEIRRNGFLPLQKSLLNSCITNEQQVNELEKIIDNQGKYYASLRENKEKILMLAKFRIPYYVGPLCQDEKSPFKAWIQYKGKKEGHITPWNLEERVDLGATAENFAERATNYCTFLNGEKVLPKHSLVYEEYMLLNELNSMYITYEGLEQETTIQESMQGTGVDPVVTRSRKEKPHRILEAKVKARLIREVFAKQKRVSVEYVNLWLERNAYRGKRKIQLVNRENVPVEKFAARMNARVDMEKILGREIKPEYEENLEKIIKWSTLYTDRNIYVKRLREEMAPFYTPEQIRQFEGLRYTGWGKYSRKLLCDPLCNYTGKEEKNKKNHKNGQIMSVLEAMREHHSTLMRIYHFNEYHLKEKIGEYNQKRTGFDYADIVEMPISPIMKRPVWTALKIVDEIRRVMGGEPKYIFIRNMRDDNTMKKRLNEKNMTRYEHLRAYYKAYEQSTGEKVSPELKSMLQRKKDGKISDTEYLYLLQLGRCMYSGEKIDLNSPSTYIIDNVVPLYLTTDKTLMNNQVLVRKNKRTQGQPLAKYSIEAMKPYWQTLMSLGMITSKKYYGLIIEKYDEDTYTYFINNQLTDNNLLIERMTWILRGIYKQSNIYGINSKLTDDVRKKYGLYYISSLNNMQQAYDAFLTVHLGTFAKTNLPAWVSNGGKAVIEIKKLEKKGIKDKNGVIINSYEEKQAKEEGKVYNWSGPEERIRYLQKVYSWHDGFITRKTVEYTGKFYKETLYRPVGEAFVTEKKGSHKQAFVAYMDVIQYTDKDGETWKELINVPAYIAVTNNKIEDYIRNDLGLNEQNGVTNLKILRSKILLNQEAVVQGHPYYLRTASEWINAKQLYIKHEYAKSVMTAMVVTYPKEMTVMDTDDENEMRKAAEYLTDKFLSEYPIYNKLGKNIEIARPYINGMPACDVMNLIKALVYSMGTRSERVQHYLKEIRLREKEEKEENGKSIKGDNRLSNKRLRVLDSEKIMLIHRSPAGMYVKKEEI